MDDYERREQLELFGNQIAEGFLEEINKKKGQYDIPQKVVALWQGISLHRIAEALERQVALLQDEIYPTLEVIAGERRGRHE